MVWNAIKTIAAVNKEQGFRKLSISNVPHLFWSVIQDAMSSSSLLPAPVIVITVSSVRCHITIVSVSIVSQVPTSDHLLITAKYN